MKQQTKQLNWKKVISFCLVAFGMVLLFAHRASAKECQSVYGGGQVCETGDLTLNKKVYNPATKSYVDNIESNVKSNNDAYIFKPGEEVKFSLTIKNISDIKVDNARINDDFDKLDEYLDFVSSDDNQGDYRQGETDWKVKFDKFGSMDKDSEKTVYFTARVKAADKLPVGVTCLTNIAHAYSHDDVTSDTDSAEFCIGTDSGKIVTVKTPDTGINIASILGLEAAALTAVGVTALRKAKKLSK